MKPIVVVGSINMDLVSHTDHIPKAGETVLGESFEMHSGGKGANQAVAVARLGYPSVLLGAVGDDAFGSRLLTILESAHVDVSYVKETNGSSGTATIVVDSKGENTIIVTAGANLAVTPQYLEGNREVLANAGMVLTQLEIPVESVAWLGDFCSDHGVPFILDPAPAMPLPNTLMKKITWFTPNQTEASFYAKDRDDTDQILTCLFGMGVENIILKQGSRGAVLATADGPRKSISPFTVKSLDSTAAGDAFNGAFAVSMMRGNTPADSARYAAAAAAISVTRRGAQPSLANEDEVLSLFRGEFV